MQRDFAASVRWSVQLLDAIATMRLNERTAAVDHQLQRRLASVERRPAVLVGSVQGQHVIRATGGIPDVQIRKVWTTGADADAEACRAENGRLTTAGKGLELLDRRLPALVVAVGAVEDD